MLWCEVIELGQAIDTITNGEPIRTYTWTTVYADKRSAKMSEKMNASLTGMKPEVVFTIRTLCFSDHEKVRWNAKEYFIVDTYENGDFIELKCTSKVA